jgi:hypothetical protein
MKDYCKKLIKLENNPAKMAVPLAQLLRFTKKIDLEADYVEYYKKSCFIETAN